MGAVKETGAVGLGVDVAGYSNSTAIGRMGFELGRDWRIQGVPLRTRASVSWIHDFEVDPRSLGVHLQASPENDWEVTSEERSSNALRAGISAEVGLSERRTLRIYGEQQIQQNRRVLNGGVTVIIVF
jgi:hypothetical protein